MKKNNSKVKKIFLFINTSKEKELDVFLLNNNKIINKLSIKGDFKVSENLLKLINKLLKKSNLLPDQLKGIMAVSGPGPFTSLRIAAAVANTLAFVLQIPIAGIANKDNVSDLSLIKKALKEMKIGNYIQPFYNREPNITISK